MSRAWRKDEDPEASKHPSSKSEDTSSRAHPGWESLIFLAQSFNGLFKTLFDDFTSKRKVSIVKGASTPPSSSEIILSGIFRGSQRGTRSGRNRIKSHVMAGALEPSEG